ncbi:hypothetical protein EDB92DRAFT_1878056, partial [Lactarius akahatsu]
MAVSVIKCRLCPTDNFKNWACFFRHCRDCEEHPVEIKCCERCGIYFGRQDSKKRHKDSATRACCETTPDEAAWRKYKAEQLLAAFQARVEYCLKRGEELGPKFAAIAMAELPSKSKKAFFSIPLSSLRRPHACCGVAPQTIPTSCVRLVMIITIPVSVCFRFFVCVLYVFVLFTQSNYLRSGCKGRCV